MIVVLGGHSSGLLVADSIERLRSTGSVDLEVGGFLNDEMDPGDGVGRFPVLGGFERWIDLSVDVRFIAAFPLPGAAEQRHSRLLSLGIPRDRFRTVCDPAAIISPTASIGTGCYIAPGVVVEHGAVVAAHSILRAHAYISHDARVGEFAFIGPHVTLLGRTTFGQGVHVGGNSVVREGIKVGNYALVGIGSTVIRDVSDHEVVAGSPAKVLPARTGADHD